jgi:hypothetical protein
MDATKRYAVVGRNVIGQKAAKARRSEVDHLLLAVLVTDW